MRIFLLVIVVASQVHTSFAQNEGKWLRAFPITGYMVDLNDSTRVVQVEMPEGLVLPDGQFAMAYGLYNSSTSPVLKGYGRCHLIKGVYHYFAIGFNRSLDPLAEGDLLYMFLDSTNIFYGRIPKLASHFIRLQDVYEKSFYDRYLVFNNWTTADERKVLDSMVADIRFTGAWMKENNPGQDVQIENGRYSSKSIFEVMISASLEDLMAFLDFMIENPRNYAGANWKVTEIFATWLSRNPL